MLAIELVQVQTIAIAVLIAFCVIKFMKMKTQHQPRELIKDESSKIEIDLDERPEQRVTLADDVGADIALANASLQTKLALLDSMLVEADREFSRLTELLHEARTIRIPGVVRDDDVESTPSEASEDATLKLSTAAIEQTAKVDKQQFVRLLHQSGFSPEEVAKAVNLPLEIVLAILRKSGQSGRAAS